MSRRTFSGLNLQVPLDSEGAVPRPRRAKTEAGLISCPSTPGAAGRRHSRLHHTWTCLMGRSRRKRWHHSREVVLSPQQSATCGAPSHCGTPDRSSGPMPFWSVAPSPAGSPGPRERGSASLQHRPQGRLPGTVYARGDASPRPFDERVLQHLVPHEQERVLPQPGTHDVWGLVGPRTVRQYPRSPVRSTSALTLVPLPQQATSG